MRREDGRLRELGKLKLGCRRECFTPRADGVVRISWACGDIRGWDIPPNRVLTGLFEASTDNGLWGYWIVISFLFCLFRIPWLAEMFGTGYSLLESWLAYFKTFTNNSPWSY